MHAREINSIEVGWEALYREESRRRFESGVSIFTPIHPSFPSATWLLRKKFTLQKHSGVVKAAEGKIGSTFKGGATLDA